MNKSRRPVLMMSVAALVLTLGLSALAYAEAPGANGRASEKSGGDVSPMGFGDVVEFFDAPSGECHGLAWDGVYLWTTDYAEELVYRINTSGSVVASFDAPGTGHVIGVAWHDGYVWAIDWTTNTIYKMTTSGTVVEEVALDPSPPGGSAARP